MTFVTPVMEHYLNEKSLNGSTMKDRSDDPSHHERKFYHGVTSHSQLLEGYLYILQQLIYFILLDCLLLGGLSFLCVFCTLGVWLVFLGGCKKKKIVIPVEENVK